MKGNQLLQADVGGQGGQMLSSTFQEHLWMSFIGASGSDPAWCSLMFSCVHINPSQTLIYITYLCVRPISPSHVGEGGRPRAAAWGHFISLCKAVSSGLMPFYCPVQDSLCPVSPGTSSMAGNPAIPPGDGVDLSTETGCSDRK